jgi:hypothetical protein
MYVTVRRYTGNTELVDALVENETGVKEVLTGIAGFRSYYLVRTDDGALSVSVYDDRNGAEESNRQAAQWLGENLPDLKLTAPQVTAGEAVVAF